ncbi:MAG: hypothetical protein WAT74_06385 [Flavobacteriales bacterium]
MKTSQLVAQGQAQHKGVFTDELLKCLRGQVAEVMTHIAAPQPAAVIAPDSLKRYVPNKVVESISDVSLRARQKPDIRIQSDSPPHFIVEFPPRATPADTAPDIPSITVLSTTTVHNAESLTERTLKSMKGKSPRPGSKPQPAPPGELYRATDLLRLTEENPGIGSDIDNLIASHGRAHFETQTGFSVFGAKVSHAYSDCGACEPFGDDPVHIRHHFSGLKREQGTIVIELDGREFLVLAVLFGYIGTIVVKDGRVATVNYTPSENSQYGYLSVKNREQLDHRRAVVATLAANGRFRVDAAHAEKSADYLRVLKSIDPTLGLYAAYAYQSAGLFNDVSSVYEWMSNEDTVIPYDVVMLAGKLKKGRAAPFCPMLVQGWSYLDEADMDQLHLLSKLRRFVQPGLWTTFRVDAKPVLERMLKH